MRYDHPRELADHLVFLSLIDANFSDEFGNTLSSVFADAKETLEHFLEHTPTVEGRERLRECARNLHVAFDCLKGGDDVAGADLVKETAAMFERCRKYIALSNE